MNIRLFLTSLFLFFLFYPVMAQDTAKSVEKPPHSAIKPTQKKHHNDSLKASHPKSHSYVKDTTKTHKVHPVKIPKYKRDGYVAILGGYGIPTGAYALSGFASTGSNFSVSAGFPGIISHCGIAFKFDYGTNALNQTQYINSLNNEINLPNINYSFTGTLEKFNYKTLLTGLYLTYPAKKISIDARILGGVMLATYPAFAVNIVDPANGEIGTVYQSETKGNAFAIDFGIQVRYHVLPKLSIMLSADYLHAAPSFTDVVTGFAVTPNGISLQDYLEGTADQAFSLFNFSLGVGYTLSAQKPTAPKNN